jgi:hypothetical protein
LGITQVCLDVHTRAPGCTGCLQPSAMTHSGSLGYICDTVHHTTYQHNKKMSSTMRNSSSCMLWCAYVQRLLKYGMYALKVRPRCVLVHTNSPSNTSGMLF